MPVNCSNSPAIARRYRPFGSRSMQVSNAVSTNTSRKRKPSCSWRCRAWHRSFGVRTDDGHEADNSGVGEKSGHLGNSATVLHAVARGEPEIRVQSVTQVVGVEHVRRRARGGQLGENEVGDRRLAGAGQAGQPDRQALDSRTGPTPFAGNGARLPDRPRSAGRRLTRCRHAGATVNTAFNPNGSTSISASHVQSDMR